MPNSSPAVAEHGASGGLIQLVLRPGYSRYYPTIARYCAFHLLIGLLLGALSACAPNRAFRTLSEIQTPCIATTSTDCAKDTFFIRKSAVSSAVDVSIGVIEFDDTGALMNREHKDQLVNKVRLLAKDQDVIIAVFAHGWKHNAAATDSNFRDFQDFTLKLAESENQRCADSICNQREVVGLYLGWRGLSALLPGFKELSFWNRKQRAERIGQDGVTEVLSELRKIQTTKRIDPATGKNAEVDNRLILVGHSFGGALLFSATQQVLQQSASFLFNNDVPRLIADMIILVNPALEAARMSAIHDRAQSMSFDNSQRTVLAIFTSESDIATKRAFPLGRRFSTLFNSYREGRENEQYERDIRAIGHYAPYVTHTLKVTNQQAVDEGYAASVCSWFDFKNTETNTWDLKNGTELKRTKLVSSVSQRNNPFFNIRVSNQLIAGHNSIWGDQFRDFLYRFVAVQDERGCTEQ